MPIGGPAIVPGATFVFDSMNPRSYSGSGTVCYDLISKAAGTMFNTAVDSANGAIFFNGANSSIQFINTINTKADFTVGVLIYPSRYSTNESWFDTIGTGGGIRLATSGASGPTGDLELDIRSSNVTIAGPFTASTYNANTSWYYLVGTYNSSANVSYVYSNGVSVASKTAFFANAVGSSTANIFIGACANPVFARGYLSFVHFYQRELNSTEIAQNFHALRLRVNL